MPVPQSAKGVSANFSKLSIQKIHGLSICVISRHFRVLWIQANSAQSPYPSAGVLIQAEGIIPCYILSITYILNYFVPVIYYITIVMKQFKRIVLGTFVTIKTHFA